MVQADFSGDFVNIENVKDGDIGRITADAEYKDINKDGKIRKVLNVPVNINGKEKIYSPSNDDGKQIVKAFGSETKNWIGQQLKFYSYKYNSYGTKKDAIGASPIVTEKI